jgi:hypothetical protein
LGAGVIAAVRAQGYTVRDFASNNLCHLPALAKWSIKAYRAIGQREDANETSFSQWREKPPTSSQNVSVKYRAILPPQREKTAGKPAKREGKNR